MPTYEFRCTECGIVTEELVSIKDRDKPVACEKCGEKTERMTSFPQALRFRGSGFHATDYSKTGPKQ